MLAVRGENNPANETSATIACFSLRVKIEYWAGARDGTVVISVPPSSVFRISLLLNSSDMLRPSDRELYVAREASRKGKREAAYYIFEF
jgi:hypothetical protein